MPGPLEFLKFVGVCAVVYLTGRESVRLVENSIRWALTKPPPPGPMAAA